MIYQSSIEVEAPVAPPQKRTLVLAILAPFGVIALMASPLLFDAARQAFGL